MINRRLHGFNFSRTYLYSIFHSQNLSRTIVKTACQLLYAYMDTRKRHLYAYRMHGLEMLGKHNLEVPLSAYRAPKIVQAPIDLVVDPPPQSVWHASLVGGHDWNMPKQRLAFLGRGLDNCVKRLDFSRYAYIVSRIYYFRSYRSEAAVLDEATRPPQVAPRLPGVQAPSHQGKTIRKPKMPPFAVVMS